MDIMGGILTKGLGGDCSAMIIGPFRLKLEVELVDIPTGGPGGVGLPRPIDTSRPEEIEKLVRFYAKFGEREFRREFIVSEDRGQKIIKVTRMINNTFNNISIKVDKFKRSVGNLINVIFTRK